MAPARATNGGVGANQILGLGKLPGTSAPQEASNNGSAGSLPHELGMILRSKPCL